MQDTITIRETFSTRDDAEEARLRLEYGGFARNSMNIMQIGGQYDLAIHTGLRIGNGFRIASTVRT